VLAYHLLAKQVSDNAPWMAVLASKKRGSESPGFIPDFATPLLTSLTWARYHSVIVLCNTAHGVLHHPQVNNSLYSIQSMSATCILSSDIAQLG